MISRVLVTGGAGFIGSHLVDRLMNSGYDVVVFDNLSSGNIKNIEHWIGNENFRFIEGDLLHPHDISKAVSDCDIVFNLAANPEVRVGLVKPEIHFQNNIVATFNLLEAVKNAKTEHFVFSSSSTVYGEASKIPTPEDYSPLLPISVYGASKLACEALVTSYAYIHGFKALILRLANIVGPRSRHGVIYDFIAKLKKNPTELEVLGDGSQTKSYLYIDDCIDAILLVVDKTKAKRVDHVGIYNIGSEDQVEVRKIADIVINVMKLKDVKLRFTGGVNGGRGWKGDVKKMLLDVSKLKVIGWKPHNCSEEAIRKTTSVLLFNACTSDTGCV